MTGVWDEKLVYYIGNIISMKHIYIALLFEETQSVVFMIEIINSQTMCESYHTFKHLDTKYIKYKNRYILTVLYSI